MPTLDVPDCELHYQVTDLTPPWAGRVQTIVFHYGGERVEVIEPSLVPAQFERVVEASAVEHGPARPEASAHRVPGNALFLWRQSNRVMRRERYFAATGRASLIITDRSFLSQLVDRSAKQGRPARPTLAVQRQLIMGGGSETVRR